MFDCIHCKGIDIVEADNALSDKVRDLERQSVHSAIMAELQRLTSAGVEMDWPEQIDDEEDAIPELTATMVTTRPAPLRFRLLPNAANPSPTPRSPL